MNYRETTDYLFGAMRSFQQVGAVAYKAGLERIEGFCGELGNPHLRYRTIHIAGTNGKGSTSHLLASVLQCDGLRVGLYTSPHLRDFRERIRIDGECISEMEVVEFVERYREAMERHQLSFFEMTAAMAFDHFARHGVDIAVVETGLGGRLDATNIITAEVSVITNIGLDHTQFLGDTIPEIASEKAGIIKSATPVVIGERGALSDVVFEQRASEMACDLVFAQSRYEVVRVEERSDCQYITVRDLVRSCEVSYRLDLVGDYQRHNLLTALTALDLLGLGSDEARHEGVGSVAIHTSLQGRWQRLGDSPLVICDTGHNSHGLAVVTRQIARQSYERLFCVLGFVSDKDVSSIVALFPPESYFIATQPSIERALPCEDLGAVMADLSLDYEVVSGVNEAVARAKEMAGERDMIYVGGSTFVVADLNIC